MGATWSDFTLVGSVSGSGPGTLTLDGIQENDIIIAAAAVYTPYPYSPALPTIDASGIDTLKIFEKNSAPYHGYWDYYRWYYYWRYYYWYWWYYYNYWYWWYRYPLVTAKVKVLRANEAGTISVDFGEPSGYGAVFSTILRAWKPNISVGANEAIKNLGFTESSQGVTARGSIATIPVNADDLLLAMGVDVTPWYDQANISISGPSVQELLDFFPQYAGRSVRIKLWRIKTTTTAQLTYSYCHVGRFAQKFIPNVEVVQTSYPVVSEDLAFVEIQAELTAAGRIVRPKWFEDLRTEYAWSKDFGLRKRWMREAASETSGSHGDTVSRTRVIEMWKVPEEAVSSIPTGEAYIYDDEQTAEDRVTALDMGW